MKRSAVTVALMMAATLLSKLLGLLRGILVAAVYGTSAEAVAFSTASKIPLSLFDLLFSAAIIGCFIPVYNSFGPDRRREASGFVSGFWLIITAVTGALALGGILFSDTIISIAAPGLGELEAALASRLLAILFPILIVAGSVYTLIGLLQSKGKYLLPASVSVLSNAVVIVYLVFFAEGKGEGSVISLAIVYLISWAVQLVTLSVPFIRSRSLPSAPALSTPEIKSAFGSALPVLLGSWQLPAAALAGTFFASFSEVPGAVTIVDLANSAFVLAAGICTVSICNFIFPGLSRMHASGENFNPMLSRALLAAMALTAAAAAVCLPMSRDLMICMYAHGSFSVTSAEMSAKVFAALAASMPAYAVSELLMRAFYSARCPRPAAVASVTGVAVNVATAAAAIFIFDAGLFAIGAAAAAGQTVTAIVLLLFSVRYLPGLFGRKTPAVILKLLISTAVAVGAVYFVSYLLPFTSAVRLVASAVAGGSGFVATALILKLFGPIKSKGGDAT